MPFASDLRRKDAPSAHGSHKTLCNRFRRWAEKGIWEEIFAALAVGDLPERARIDSTIARAHDQDPPLDR